MQIYIIWLNIDECELVSFVILFFPVDKRRKSNRNSRPDLHWETNMVIGDSVRGPLACLWPLPMAVAQEGIKMSWGICSAWLLDSQTHCLHYLTKACSHLAPRLSRAALSKRRCLPSGLGSQQRVCSFSLELVENVPAHTHVDVKGVRSSRGFAVWVSRPDHD